MAIPESTYVFDVADCKIAKMLTDPIGGPATYDTPLDVPGINQVSVEPEFVSAVLKGDARTLARRARIDSFNFSVGYSLLSLDVIGLLYDATITESTGADSPRKMTIKGGGSLPYIKLGFTILDAEVGIGSINVYGLKTQITGGNLFDQSTEQFGGRSFSVSAIPTLADGAMFETEVHPDVPKPLFTT